MNGRALICAMFLASIAQAEDNVLLIQVGSQGTKVWHTEGESHLDDDDILEIMTTAKSDGGPEVPTTLGPAQAFTATEATMIRLPAVSGDNALLIERDACGHIKTWHAAGKAQLTAEQIDEALLTALPGGGKRMLFGEYYAKAFLNNVGVTVTLWRVPARKSAP